MKHEGRTGVLTFHRCINYGSYWQARCLVEGLRARGQDAVLLEHESPGVTGAEWRCALRPVLPTPVPRGDVPRYAVKLLRFLREFAALPRSAPFPVEAPERMEPFERVVVGSDEVWNLHHPWYGRCELFWGTGIRARHLVAYAASFGNYHAWEGLSDDWARRLARFEAISVRDENSWWLVKNGTGVEPEMVLDPCLQFPVRPEGAWRGPRQPYVAVYGHNFSEAFAREVRRWAAGRGLPVVSIGYRNDWADRQWITAGPHDFAHFMARAEAVATNFFHGCVFALRHEKPFVCEATRYRSIKVENLLAALGGEAHLVREETPPAGFGARLEAPPAAEVRGRIAELRRRSEGFLERALGSRPEAAAAGRERAVA